MDFMRNERRFSLALIAGDFASVVLAFNVVAIARGIITADTPFFWALLIPAFFVLVATALTDGYSPRTDFLSLDYASQHLLAQSAAALATLVVTYVVFTEGLFLQTSRLVTVFSFLIIAQATLGLRRVLCLRRVARRANHATIFVGDAGSAKAFAEECERARFRRPLILASASPEDAEDGRPALEDLLAAIESEQLKAEAIVLRESTRDLPPGMPQRPVRLHFAGVPTYTLELFHEVVWRKIPLYRINPVWLSQEGFSLARDPFFERIKRASDIALATLGLLLATPFLLLAALAIRLDDGGPVFFRQTRIGLHRRPFTLYKLRTMRADRDGGRYTVKGDSRITRVGHFLRATRLDELPQLWNVLKGEMSMIGPRAEWDVLVADYEKQIPCYHFRHLVHPGITGWAQINYPYGGNIEDTLRKLEYDLYYIRHYSFRLDAAIVLKTIHVMLFGKGSR
jgi:exopolysaccharide biosynthesis polyprenyl glycosylphosphotransferase